jgi:hypothetical protein
MQITLTGVAVLVSMLIGWGFKIWREIKKDELTASQQDQLENVSYLAVRASEELAEEAKSNPDKTTWTAEEKYEFASEAILEGAKAISPKLAASLSPEMITMLITGAIQAVGLGASGKNQAKNGG